MAGWVRLATALAVQLCACDAGAAEPAAGPELHPGAFEVGLAGSLTAVEGAARGTAQLRSGFFLAGGPVLVAIEPEMSYTHVGGLDVIDVEVGLSAQRRIGASGIYGFAAVGGGLRQEWLGSYRQARYPLGVGVGLLALANERAAFRVEYRYRRILSDPVADFDEQVLLAGVSILFRNAR